MKIKKSELSKIIAEIVAEELKEVNYTQTTAGKSVPAVGAPNSIARFAVEHPEIIQQMKEWVKDCQWRDVCEPDEVDEMSDIEILQGVEKHYEGGIKKFVQDSKQTQEGCGGAGYVYDKDMKKDPKHISGERWRIKFASDDDIEKHGSSEKLTTETISRKEIKAVIKELINEMWVGFEEEEEGKISEIQDPQQNNMIISRYLRQLPSEELKKIQELMKQNNLNVRDALIMFVKEKGQQYKFKG